MNRSRHPAIASAVVLALSANANAQTTMATAAAAPPKPAPAKKAASAGLVNDWLRQQSAEWKPWDLGGQFRARFELFEDGGPAYPTRDFQRDGVDNDNSFLWLRERLHLGYTADWLTAYAEGRNSNSIGDDDTRDPGEDSFDLHQGYVSIGNVKEFPLTAKIGRQELLYGDERLVGPSDWSNTARSFDAAKLRFENKDLWIDAFASRVVVNDDEEFNEPDHDSWFFGAYASSKSVIPHQETDLYFFSRNTSAGGSTSARDIYSMGARVKSLPGQLKGWDYSAEVVGQLGSISQSGQRRDQRAFASAASVGYTWSKTYATPRVGLEYCYSTGDSDPTDDTSETLDNLYPTNHGKYRYMDFVGWRNIHNPRLMLSAKPHKKLTVALDYHLFWLADTHDFFYPQSGSGRKGLGYDRNPGFDSFVGSEINFDVNYAVTPYAGARAGYGHFFTGSYVEASKQANGGSTDADWFYVQAVFNF